MRIHALLAMVMLAHAAWPAAALGANQANCNLTGDLASGNLGTGSAATFSLNAYSIQNQSIDPPFPQVGPNENSSATTVSRGAAPAAISFRTNGSYIAVPTGQMYKPMIFDGGKLITLPERMSTNTSGPTISAGPLSKSSLSLPNDYANVQSTSAIYNGVAQAFVSSKGVRGIFASAYIAGNPPPGGAAAGQALDPINVPSGSSYPYTPTVTGSLEIDSTTVTGGFSAFVIDSSVFTSDTVDNFVADGEPMSGMLWSVTVGSDTPTNTAASVLVDFELNPLALNEIQFPSAFLASLGTYSDATTESLLIEEAIDQSLASQMTQTGNEFDLVDASLFPAGTMFEAIAGGVEYADDVDAGIAAAPEPASAALVIVGLAGLLLHRRRQDYPVQ
jgi:MYXO-CTERM domain-containing protein